MSLFFSGLQSNFWVAGDRVGESVAFPTNGKFLYSICGTIICSFSLSNCHTTTTITFLYIIVIIFLHHIPTDISNALNFMWFKANDVCYNHMDIYSVYQ